MEPKKVMVRIVPRRVKRSRNNFDGRIRLMISIADIKMQLSNKAPVKIYANMFRISNILKYRLQFVITSCVDEMMAQENNMVVPTANTEARSFCVGNRFKKLKLFFEFIGFRWKDSLARIFPLCNRNTNP